MLSDQLIESIARGEQGAFRALHHELYGALFYYAHTMTGDRQVAEDVIQEAFVKFWGARLTFDSAVAAKVYLYHTVRNLLRNHLRDTASHSRILGGLELPSEATADDIAMITAETCRMVRAAVETLPAQTRRVIELSMDEMTVDDIAHRMGISANSVKTLKKAGYRTLREKLGSLHTLLPILLL